MTSLAINRSVEKSSDLGNIFNKIKSWLVSGKEDRVADLIESWYGKDIANWFRKSNPTERESFIDKRVRIDEPWRKFHMQEARRKGAKSYLSVGDRVRSMVRMLRGKVPSNTKGLVIETDQFGNALVHFDNGAEGWVKQLELDVIYEPGRYSFRKRSLDEFAKSYWSNYLEGTGLDEQILKMAFNKVKKILKEEDSLVDFKKLYRDLAREFDKAGGMDFIRKVRAIVLGDVCREYGIGSVYIKRSKNSDLFIAKRNLRACYHVVGDIGIIHLKNKKELKRFSKDFDKFDSGYSLPKEWEDGK